ncbi:MAG: aminoglycoside phosphotransferase family protein [bacterium]
MKTPEYDLAGIARNFRIPGDFISAEPYGSGHINDTFASIFDQDGTAVRYIHQRINHQVFKQPALVMENIERVLNHLHAKLKAAGSADIHRRAMTLVSARDGKAWFVDHAGNTWRTYVFIEKATTYDVVASTSMAHATARSFGEFQGLLADLPGGRLHETIPGFHDTPKRFMALEEAIRTDAVRQARQARPEIEFALARKAMTNRLIQAFEDGRIPERITHNDTKLNNVMIDNATGQGVCVIDLDTVMPGLALYDFGDMARTATRSSGEDEQDLSKVLFKDEMFEALVRGYLESAGHFLNPQEIDFLAFSASLITFEIGIRFLTDHLSGNTYFKIHRPDQNLDRCRVQFKMVQEMEARREVMEAAVRRYARS